MSTPPYLDFFDPLDYLAEFRAFLPAVAYSERNPLNTEMFFLWCMIRSQKPALFIESGTFRGYSAHFICAALQRNAADNAPGSAAAGEFITFGFNLEDCLPAARARLVAYPFARVVESDSRLGVRAFQGEKRKTAFFIDGPKGRNMPALFFAIQKNFANVAFVAVHDCQPESTSGNRTYFEQFYNVDSRIFYCASPFQEQFAELDHPLIGRPEMLGWRPYWEAGAPTPSYGTQTGYAIPRPPAQNPLANLDRRLMRWFKLNLSLEIRNRARRLLNRSARDRPHS